MTIYIDSSVLLRYLLQHPGYVDLLQYKGDFASSELLVLECRRTLIRYRLNQEINDSGFLTSNEELNDLLTRISLLKVDSDIIEKATTNWGVVLGTLDSIHLASAIHLQKAMKQSVFLLTHDKALSVAAKLCRIEIAEGIP